MFCRLTIKDNVEMIKLQKLLSEKANTFTVLEGRFLQQHEVRLTARDSSGKKIIVKPIHYYNCGVCSLYCLTQVACVKICSCTLMFKSLRSE